MNNKKRYNENIKDKRKNDDININEYKTSGEEDVTRYGEFISSYFAWLTPDKQKKRTKEIDDMTKQEQGQ